MSIAQPAGHPVTDLVARLHGLLDESGDAALWSLTADQQREALVSLARAEARLAGFRLSVLAAADRADVGADTAATSTGAWLAQATRQDRSAAHRDVRMAQALDTGHPLVRDALLDGHLDLAQTRAVVRAVDALPENVSPTDRERAGKHLLHLAGEHDAAALKVLGRRVLEVLDPGVADAEDERRLASEEAAAAGRTWLQLTDEGDGSHTGRFRIPTLHAAMLTKALHAFTNPSRPGPCERPRRGARAEQLGEAFCQLLERLPADRLPTTAGGSVVTVGVMVPAERLAAGIGAARLDTGHEVSMAEARRLACDAGIVPAVYRRVMGAPSVVLDLGRRTRLHTAAQRLALTLRDRGCTAEGCDRPPGWCQAHHDRPWAAGGATTLDNARLLCPFHHRRAHDPRYDATEVPTGRVAFHRRT